jgi:hypothetical protein
MGTRGTIILALLVVVGVAYLLSESPPPEERPPQATLLGEPRVLDPTQPVTPLLEFEPSEIVQVVLVRDGRRLVATRAGDGWSGVGSAGRIADFLDNLKGLAVLMQIEAGPDDLSLYGLDPPWASIELARSTGEPLVILLGDRNPAATGAYVRIGRAGKVVLAGALIVWEFDKAFKAMAG